MKWIKREGEHRFRSFRLLPEVTVIAVIVLVRLAGGLQYLEWSALDKALRLRPTEPPDDRVAIVGIQEPDIRGAGKYPVPDQMLAQILNQLQTYKPAAIGVDIFRDLPVEPGHQALVRAFQAENVIVVHKVSPGQNDSIVKPPADVPPDRLGFADLYLDDDGKLRRGLLGTPDNNDNYQFSLAIQLAALYLAPRGMSLDNGINDPNAMRFGAVEIPRFQPNSGSYVNADAGGNQTLINFRNRRNPFRFITLTDLQKGVNPDWLRGKIVLIGYMAPSVKDLITSNAIVTDNPALIYGVEMHAHIISQIISGVLDGRPFLYTWWDAAEYIWIVLWGAIGIAIGRLIHAPWRSVLWLVISSAGLIAISYGLLMLGWWIPVVPAFLALLINGAILAAFYRYDEALRSRLEDRQNIIDQTFDTIHSVPLQTLAQLLRQLKGEGMPADQLLVKLEQLNRELRDVYDAVRQEALNEAHSVYLEHERELDLQRPIHKTLYDVYTAVVERELPGFKTIKLKVVKFDALDERGLTTEQKRGLCRFLEEALCNVGKHAIDPTRVEVTCAQIEGCNVIRVVDNGRHDAHPQKLQSTTKGGMGTRRGEDLAKQLGGKFQRLPNVPKGTMCELVWMPRKSWFWWLAKK